MAGLSSARCALTRGTRKPPTTPGRFSRNCAGWGGAPTVVCRSSSQPGCGISVGGVPIDSESAVGGNSDVRDLAIDCQQP